METMYENSTIDHLLTQRDNYIDDIPNRCLLKPVYKEETVGDPCFTLEAYKPLQLLGKGGFSKVYLVRKKDSGKIYAMKIISKKFASKWSGELVKREFQLMKESSHPLIVNLMYVFPTDTTYNFVLEFCPGGSLYQNLVKNKKFNLKTSLIYFSEILLMIEYLHSKDILFRDLKVRSGISKFEGGEPVA